MGMGERRSDHTTAARKDSLSYSAANVHLGRMTRTALLLSSGLFRPSASRARDKCDFSDFTTR